MNESINPDDIVIRPASMLPGSIGSESEPSDASQIARIYNHYVNVGEATFDRAEWSQQHVIELLQIGHPDGHYVAAANGTVWGWASARRFSDRHGFRMSCETAIYLDPDAIGLAIADPLQIQIDAHCREHGIHHAVAKIIADNERSMAFHYRHGYELVGIQKEIGHVNGQWADVAILQKLFVG